VEVTVNVIVWPSVVPAGRIVKVSPTIPEVRVYVAVVGVMNSLMMSLKEPVPDETATLVRVGVVELVSLRVPLTANDEPAWIVSAFAAGLIARAVANATNANANFFMFPSGD